MQHHLIKIRELLDRMEQAYSITAAQMGFNCRGCRDNCCRSLFFHHTVAEFFWLQSGMSLLPQIRQAKIKARASDQTALDIRPGDKILCPLNESGRCILYPYRPMICRLHGIPHELRRPDGQRLTGPGCDDFYRQTNPAKSLRFDRTPWYAALAQLEKKLRREIGHEGKINMTIAQMLTTETPRLEIP